MNFISWMVCYSELHGQSDPEKLTTVLPAFLNKSELFKIYQAEAPQPHVKSSTFYYLFRKEFGFNRSNKLLPNIRISKYSSHSKASHKNTSLLINFDIVMCNMWGSLTTRLVHIHTREAINTKNTVHSILCREY